MSHLRHTRLFASDAIRRAMSSATMMSTSSSSASSVGKAPIGALEKSLSNLAVVGKEMLGKRTTTTTGRFGFAASSTVTQRSQGFHTTIKTEKSRDKKTMPTYPDNYTGKINPRPRGIAPPITPWEAGKQNNPDQWGKAGGGMPAFTPTSQLKKRKNYHKRCAFIMQTLEHEKMTEIAAKSPVVPFRPGDVVKVKIEVLENRRRANYFTGICIARRNRGIGSTFTLRTVLANAPVERTFPLYSPTIKEFEVLERRKVRRGKLYYLRDKPLRFSRG